MAERTAARYILSHRSALAQAVVARQYAYQPDLRQRYGDGGMAKCVQDTDYTLSYLAAALNYSSPAIFQSYIAWAKNVLEVRHVRIEDVDDNLRFMESVLREKLPDGCAAAAAPYFDEAIRTPPQGVADHPPLLEGDDPLSELARRYLGALLRTDRAEASDLIQTAFRSGVPITDLYLRVFQRCQQEIGRLWQLNQLSVAEEHYCTAATQFVMAQLHPLLFSLPKTGRRLMATSVAGEYHEVGLRIVTDLFEANGWESVYLGANVPARSLIQALEQHHSDVLAISATMPFHLPVVEELIALIRSSHEVSATKIMVGGRPFNMAPDLWRRVGADCYAADAGEALEIANRLIAVVPATESHAVRSAPTEFLATTADAQPELDTSRFAEFSRLTSDLLTAQRELAKKNADLEREITERKRLEDQVRQAEVMEAVGRLAGGMAHSLNNLMTTVLGHGEITLDRMRPSDPSFASVQEIMRASTRTAALTQKLLAFGRKQLLTLRPLSLTAVVSELEPTLRAIVGRVRLELELDPGVTLTKTDPDHLEKTVLTLVRNALDAMPDGGTLTIQTCGVDLGEDYAHDHPEVSPGRYVLLAVSDTGTGMDEESLGHLFEPFVRELISGSGLGLAAVYGFMKQCGGDIGVQSVVDEGTSFRLYFPAHAGDEAKASLATALGTLP